MNPVVVAVAITGSVPRKKDNPAVPILPFEQIESTHQAFEAGALSPISMFATMTRRRPPIPSVSPWCRRESGSTVLT